MNTYCGPVAIQALPLTQRELLEEISNKWTVMVLGVLCPQPLRFNEVLRQVDGVTQKALTQCLRRLERLGIVERTVLATSPVAVEYSITPLGRSLGTPLRTLLQWTAENKHTVEQARRTFEQRMSIEG